MPIVQIDWQKIKSKLGDDTALFALTLRQASMLLGLSEQLTWEKTFRVDDYDWADKDILDADIADLQRNLAMPTNLVDIIQYIDEIEGLLRGIQSITNCCDGDDITGGDQYTDPVVDGVGDVPANVISSGYATGVSDWAGFDDYKCMIAHIMVDQMELRLRKLHTLVDDTGDILGGVAVAVTIITTVFTTILTGGISVMALGIIASTGIGAVLWKAITDATDLNILADAVATNHDALACAIYWGDGSVDSIELLMDKIDELFTGSSAIILKNLNLEPTLKALYSGGYDQQNIAQIIADHGYDTTDFDCSCDLQLGEHRFDYNFATGPWQFVGNMEWEAAGRMRRLGTGFSFTRINPSYICNSLSIPDTQNIRIRRIGFSYQKSLSTSYPKAIIATTGAQYNWSDSALTEWIWYPVTINFDALGLNIELAFDDWIDVGVMDGPSYYAYVDDFWIEFDELG